MFGFLLKPIVTYIAVPVAILSTFAAGWFYVAHLRAEGALAREQTAFSEYRLATAERIAEAAREARESQRRADEITHARALEAARAEREIEVVTRTIVREVPVHVTPEIDLAFPLPLGFVRIHDAAASGRADPAGLPISPGEPDGAASDVRMSETANVLANNYGNVCRIAIERATQLQEWIREQQEAWTSE